MCKSSRPVRILLKTDKCDWCNKMALFTDGTYVYCSDKCKKSFKDNALQAINGYYELGKGKIRDKK